MALPQKKDSLQSADAVRVMVVDDSAVVRGITTRFLEKDGNCKVVASASNGENAIRMLDRHDVEVVVLDIDMPVMDGMTALPLMLKTEPALQVVMSSTLTERNAKITMRALELGAKDYVPKPSASEDLRGEKFGAEILRKVKALGSAARRSSRHTESSAAASIPAKEPRTKFQKEAPILYRGKNIELRKDPIRMPQIIAIGSSTGGPAALGAVLSSIAPTVEQPIVITQHMPATFTTILAQRLEKETGRPCTEATDGEVLQKGRMYVAPGDYHMTLVGTPAKPTVQLLQTAPENFCRPAVDPMLRSLAELYGPKVLTVILTGMGQDGLKGTQKLAELGAPVIAQDEATSTVWGMPGAVATDGVCHAVKPLNEIGNLITQIATTAGANL